MEDLAGIEILFFLAACMVLCCGFMTGTVLIHQFQEMLNTACIVQGFLCFSLYPFVFAENSVAQYGNVPSVSSVKLSWLWPLPFSWPPPGCSLLVFFPQQSLLKDSLGICLLMGGSDQLHTQGFCPSSPITSFLLLINSFILPDKLFFLLLFQFHKSLPYGKQHSKSSLHLV